MSGFQWVRDIDRQTIFDHDIVDTTRPYTPTDSLHGFQWVRDVDRQTSFDRNIVDVSRDYEWPERERSMGFQWTRNNDTSVQFRTQELIPARGFLIEEGGMIKTVEIDTSGVSSWVTLGPAPATADMFQRSINAQIVQQHIPLIESDAFKLLAVDIYMGPRNLNLKLTTIPAPTVVIQSTDFTIDVDAIEHMNIRYRSSSAKYIKLAVSFDSGASWQTYDTSVEPFAWRTITTSMSDLMKSGMTPNVFDSITKEEWELLRNNSDTMRFAFCLDIDKLDENKGIDEIVSIVELKGEWVHHDTDISHSTRDVIIYLYQNGTYKINYVE